MHLFLYDILLRFAKIARLHKSGDFATSVRKGGEPEKKTLINMLDEMVHNEHGDDGTPLGTSSAEDCKIETLFSRAVCFAGAGESYAFR